MGINHIAVQQSIPHGPSYAGNAFHPGDVEGAAMASPDIAFEIVHGRIAFTEETAWMLDRYPNITVNVETLNVIIANCPPTFAALVLGMMHVGGEAMLDRLFRGTGTMQYHPWIYLEDLVAFEFPPDVLDNAGLVAVIPQITKLMDSDATRRASTDSTSKR